MELTDAIRKRRMVRHFTAAPVDPAVVERLIELTRHAPSAGFTQGQAFITVTRPDLKRAIAALCHEEHYTGGGFHPFISEAPVLVIPCTSEAAYRRRYQEDDKGGPDSAVTWPVPFWYMDIGCAVQILLLAVVDAGLSAAFAGIIEPQDMDALRALLGIPAEVMPVGVIPIGHGAPDVPSGSLQRGRKAAAEYHHHEGW